MRPLVIASPFLALVITLSAPAQSEDPIVLDSGDHSNMCDTWSATRETDAVCRSNERIGEYCSPDPYRRVCALIHIEYDYNNDGVIDHVEDQCNTCPVDSQPPPKPAPQPTSDTWCDGTMGTGYCGASSPIVLNLSNGPYALADRDHPVWFDIDADGLPNLMTWTAAHTPMAFLALDRNGNGAIDDGGELFGNHTRLADGRLADNGFEALRELDTNRDNVLDQLDPAWKSLLLWIDWNHDGVATPDELQSIATSAVTALELTFHPSGRRDRSGNTFRYEALLRMGPVTQPYYDIYFLTHR